MNSINVTAAYCGPWWTRFWDPYNAVHGQVVLVICTLGVITNLINILVFTRPPMRSATNAILTALAIADLLFVLREVVKQSLYFHRQMYGDMRSSYQQQLEWVIDQVLFMLFHTWSIYLTLLLAIWRFVGITYPLQSRHWLTAKSVTWTTIITVTLSTALVGLMFFSMRIVMIHIEPPTTTATMTAWHNFLEFIRIEVLRSKQPVIDQPQQPVVVHYKIDESDLGRLLRRWIKGILIKLLPCILLTLLSLGLIRSLFQAKKDRKKLIMSETPPINGVVKETETPTILILNPSGQPVSKTSEDEDEDDGGGDRSEFDRTTIMLLVILILFIATELPPGIGQILFGILGSRNDGFYWECIQPILGFFTLSEEVSCVTSYFVYLVMSVRFRSTLFAMFGRPCMTLETGGRIDDPPSTTVNSDQSQTTTSFMIKRGRGGESKV